MILHCAGRGKKLLTKTKSLFAIIYGEPQVTSAKINLKITPIFDCKPCKTELLDRVAEVIGSSITVIVIH